MWCKVRIANSGWRSRKVKFSNGKTGFRETDQGWLELIEEADIGDKGERAWLMGASSELVAIFTAMGRTAKLRRATKR